jgi:hypothetical protein
VARLTGAAQTSVDHPSLYSDIPSQEIVEYYLFLSLDILFTSVPQDFHFLFIASLNILFFLQYATLNITITILYSITEYLLV